METSTPKKILKGILFLPRIPFLGLIWIYQKTISPDHGLLSVFFPHGYCRFSPSCSMYGYHAIKKHGVIKGIPLTMYRILRCNPMNIGGIDPVPDHFRDIKKYRLFTE